MIDCWTEDCWIPMIVVIFDLMIHRTNVTRTNIFWENIICQGKIFTCKPAKSITSTRASFPGRTINTCLDSARLTKGDYPINFLNFFPVQFELILTNLEHTHGGNLLHLENQLFSWWRVTFEKT